MRTDRPWWRGEPGRALLLLLVVTDMLFVGLHVAHTVSDQLGAFRDPAFALNRERGFAEVYGYLKLLWSAMLLALMWIRERVALTAVLAVVVGGLLLDDAATVHERLGARLGTQLGLEGVGSMGPSAAGQVVVGAVAAAGVAVVVAAAWRWAPPRWRSSATGVLLAVALLGVFGVVVDAVHAALEPTLDETLTVVEDGGELLAGTALLAWVSVCAARHHRRLT